MKKKLIISLALVIAVFAGVLALGTKSQASGADISISVDSQTVKKEEEFTVRVNVSSHSAMQYIDTMFGYDPEVLEFISSDSMAVTGASGKIHIMEEFLDPVKAITYTMTFKALEVGGSNMGVSETYISEAETFNIVPVSSDNVYLEVMTNRQESQEIRLSELMVAPGEMETEFNPDVYEYYVETPYEEETVAISAIPMDENAVVTVEKADTLAIGHNTVTISVTAPSGNVGTYVVTINRLSTPSETEVPETEILESETGILETENQTETLEPETESQTEALESETESQTETLESETESQTETPESEIESQTEVSESVTETQAVQTESEYEQTEMMTESVEDTETLPASETADAEGAAESMSETEIAE